MERKMKQDNWRIKILGIVLALPPLSSPSFLLRWYLEWKMAQILGASFLRFEEAMRRASDAFTKFGDTWREVMEEITDDIARDLLDY